VIKYRTLDIDDLWNKIDSREIEPKKLIYRFQLKKIIKRFSSDHVEVIIGPRQSGKTTFLMMLIHELAKMDITHQKTYYINLDTIGEMEQFKNPMLLVKQIEHTRNSDDRVYLFLDEVQRLESPGKFFKRYL